MPSISKRDLLTLGELEAPEILALIRRGLSMKAEPPRDAPLRGRTLGLLFEKASTRTRVSFEAAMNQLGGVSTFLGRRELQLERGETLMDTARVLSRYLDALVVRTFSHETVELWAAHCRIPVINGLTDRHHPCQALGDLMTIQERFGVLKGIRLAFLGDGHNNVVHSLIEGAAKTGLHLVIGCPRDYTPDPAIVGRSMETAKQTGSTIRILEDPREAVADADVVYTDVWVSMGQEAEAGDRRARLAPYQVNEAILGRAATGAVVMHCLPAYRGQEVSAGILDGPRAIVWDQAENRLHIQKAILEWLLMTR